MKKLFYAFALTFIFDTRLTCVDQQVLPANQAQISKPASSYKAHSPQEQTELATNMLLRYFDTLLTNNFIGAEDLSRVFGQLQTTGELVCPMSQEKRVLSIERLVLANTFGDIVKKAQKSGAQFDYARIQSWLADKIKVLEQNNRDRERMHEETRELYIPMRFAEIPVGTYIDAIDGEEFEISAGVELQETPVTQYQWASVMGDNPSTYRETVSAGDFVEDVTIKTQFVQNKKIKMRANAPVETVSYSQIQEFIDKLNADAEKNSQNYVYALPSVAEYQALLQATLGKNWLGELKKLRTCQAQNGQDNKKHTCPVASGEYLELKQERKRVWDVVGNIWQWTSNRVEDNREPAKKETSEQLVFGTAFTTRNNSTALLRPINYKFNNKCFAIGFRLLRFTKEAACKRTIKKYSRHNLNWGKEVVRQDVFWLWDEQEQRIVFDQLGSMIKFRESYSEDTRKTIDALISAGRLEWASAGGVGNVPLEYLRQLKKVSFIISGRLRELSPFASLTQLEELDLDDEKIENLEPLANLSQLKTLHISHNQIQDLAPLAGLIQLQTLYLSNNNIKKITSLAGLINLKILNLAHNPNLIQDLMPLVGLAQLEELNLEHDCIRDLSLLGRLTQLNALGLNNNRVQDLTPLIGLTRLQWLYLRNNNVQDLTPLASLLQLKVLNLAGNPIQDLKPLAGLTQNLTLYLGAYQIEKLKPREVLPKNIKVKEWN